MASASLISCTMGDWRFTSMASASFCHTMGDWRFAVLASASFCRTMDNWHLLQWPQPPFATQWETGALLPLLRHLFDIAYKNTHLLKSFTHTHTEKGLARKTTVIL